MAGRGPPYRELSVYRLFARRAGPGPPDGLSQSAARGISAP